MKHQRLIIVLLIFILVCSVKYLSETYYYEVPSSAWKDIHFETYEGTKHCLLTVCPSGNLGNQIWEYMSLYVVGKRFQQYGHIPYIGNEMSYNLEDIFLNLTIPSSNYINIAHICENRWFNKWTIPKKEELADYSKYFQHNAACKDIFLEEYSARYEDILEYGSERIKREMRFKRHLVIEAQDKLKEISASFGISHKDVVFVGMHYRGNDYLQHLYMYYRKENRDLPEHRYYRRAMQYFKRKYKNVIFILITIDEEWLQRNAQYIKDEANVVINPHFEFGEQDRIRDLLLLSHCNHSIINYGTFGLTAAFFAGGTTFVYDLNLPLDYRGATLAMGMSKMLNNWFIIT